MKKLSIISVLFISLSSTYVWAENATPAEQPSPTTTQTQTTPIKNQTTWLGVILATIPPALGAQLNNIIPSGQGVLVQSVIPNSPAAKAGIEANDVLLNYGDQKLYSPSQLSGLIKATQSGKQMDMQVVSHGQLKTITVTLEAQQSRPQTSQRAPFWQHIPPSSRLAPPNIQGDQQNNATAWDSFESVQVKTLPNGNYHAEVSYKDNNNETKSFTFEGKKEEIIEQIQKQKDLPKDKQQALLNALNMRPMQPFQSLFNAPFFQRDPFSDPFFKNMMPQDMLPSLNQFFQHPPSTYSPMTQEPKERIAL